MTRVPASEFGKLLVSIGRVCSPIFGVCFRHVKLIIFNHLAAPVYLDIICRTLFCCRNLASGSASDDLGSFGVLIQESCVPRGSRGFRLSTSRILRGWRRFVIFN